MALIMDYEAPAGANIAFLIGGEYETVIKKTTYLVSKSYIKVTSVIGSKQEVEISIGIKDARESTGMLTGRTYRFIPSVVDNAPNFIKQAYEYLKTLPEFAGAVDV